MQVNNCADFDNMLHRQQHHMSKVPIEIDSVEYSYTKTFELAELI